MVFSGRPNKRGREASILALDAYGQLILRRDLAEALLKPCPLVQRPHAVTLRGVEGTEWSST